MLQSWKLVTTQGDLVVLDTPSSGLVRLFRSRGSQYGKLSQLQRLILVALSEPRYAVMKRRAFNRTVKRLDYGKDSRVATSSLSRAYQRLEDRQHIVRFGGGWNLTDSNPYNNAVKRSVKRGGNTSVTLEEVIFHFHTRTMPKPSPADESSGLPKIRL